MTIDHIHVEPNGALSVRYAVSGGWHRRSFVPGADVSSEPQQVQDVAAATWTQAVLDAHRTERWLVNSTTHALITRDYAAVDAGFYEASFVGAAHSRTHKGNGVGNPIVPKTAPEIAAYDAAAPKLVRPEDMIERMTATEVSWFYTTTNANVRYLWARLTGRTTPANVHSPSFVNGWERVVKPAGITAGIWADAATADARLATITG